MANEEILELRHEGVSGHDFADFNKEEFETIWGGQSPLEKMDPLLSQLQLKLEFSLFKFVQKGYFRNRARKWSTVGARNKLGFSKSTCKIVRKQVLLQNNPTILVVYGEKWA